MPPLLAVNDLRVALPTVSDGGRVEAVRGISFALDRGRTLGLIGESGCGKTMTALALLQLLPEGARGAGEVLFDGTDLLKLDEPALCRLRGNRIGMVFQEPMTALNPLHTVGRQVAEPLRLHRGLTRAAARAQALRMLERVYLPQAGQRLGAYPHQLSGGQRQRVLIAAALACEPALLIADEPTTALDATLRREIIDLLLEQVRNTSMALLMISHDLDLMADVAGDLLVMYAGIVVESGPAADVLGRPAHPYTRALQAARPRLDFKGGGANSDSRVGERSGDGKAAPPRGRRLATIPGRVPDAAAPPPGCPFADRCPRVLSACRQALPAAVAVGPSHTARCIRADEP